MRRFPFIGLLSAWIVTVITMVSPAAESASPPNSPAITGDWHRFRNKEGLEIDARVVSLSSDWRSVRFERSDGRGFDFVITRLSLDDQQYLREWVLRQEAPPASSLKFDLRLSRWVGETAETKLKGRLHEAVWEKTEVGYEIAVTSLSSAPVPNLRLEYCLLMEDAVEIRKRADAQPPAASIDEPSRPWKLHRRNPVLYLFASVELPPLAFNRVYSTETGRVVGDLLKITRGDHEIHEDRIIGLMSRVVTRDGVTIAEETHLIRDYASLDWAAFTLRRDPAEAEGRGLLIELIASN